MPKWLLSSVKILTYDFSPALFSNNWYQISQDFPSALASSLKTRFWSALDSEVLHSCQSLCSSALLQLLVFCSWFHWRCSSHFACNRHSLSGCWEQEDTEESKLLTCSRDSNLSGINQLFITEEDFGLREGISSCWFIRNPCNFVVITLTVT